MSENIVFTRVDNRLIHGQVANLWVKSVPCNLVVVVDDETANNEVLKAVMKMTTDSVGVGVRFFTIEKTINTISKASANQQIMIVAKTIQTIRKLVEGGVNIKECNVGNMHYSEGKTRYKEDHIYVDQQDLDDIEYLKQKGLNVYIQVFPGDTKYTL